MLHILVPSSSNYEVWVVYGRPSERKGKRDVPSKKLEKLNPRYEEIIPSTLGIINEAWSILSTRASMQRTCLHYKDVSEDPSIEIRSYDVSSTRLRHHTLRPYNSLADCSGARSHPI